MLCCPCGRLELVGRVSAILLNFVDQLRGEDFGITEASLVSFLRWLFKVGLDEL
jgi:hypothetical protein